MKHRTPNRTTWILLLATIAVLLVGTAIGRIGATRHQEPPTAAPAPTKVTVTQETGPPNFRSYKPVQDLMPGDKVVYDALDNRPVCTVVQWYGDQSQVKIRCKGLPELTVRTLYVTSATQR